MILGECLAVNCRPVSVYGDGRLGTFVTIGNGTQGFPRLLQAVSAIASRLPQPVTVQTGHDNTELPGCVVFRFADEARFRELIRDNELIITHGGVGSIVTALEHGRKPVVVPRRSGAYGEIVNDHQISLVKELSDLGLIVPVMDVVGLADALRDASRGNDRHPAGCATPRAMGGAYLELVGDAVRRFLPRAGNHGNICLVSACGGHLTELRKLAPVYQAHQHFYVINNPIIEPPEMRGRTQVITLCERDWRGVINIWEAVCILRKERPDCIISTGAWPAIPFAIAGRLLGIPNIYIETMARVDRPTATGRVMYHLAHRFFFPWHQLERHFPKGIYCGLLL
jgi:UDP-N-acetylglucosamine transferase subunit ALG13